MVCSIMLSQDTIDQYHDGMSLVRHRVTALVLGFAQGLKAGWIGRSRAWKTTGCWLWAADWAWRGCGPGINLSRIGADEKIRGSIGNRGCLLKHL